MAAAGELGRVHCLRSVFSDPLLPRLGPRAWRARRSRGGGVILDRLIHHFDLWRFMLEDEVEEVFAVARSDQVDDQSVIVTAVMTGGAIASTIGLDDGATSHELTLYGDREAVHVDCYRFDGLQRVSLGDLPGAPGTRLRRLAQSLDHPLTSLGAIRRGGDFNATYYDEWRHFAAVVREDRSPDCGLTDGRAALEVALAVIRSASLGQPVKVAQSGEASASTA